MKKILLVEGKAEGKAKGKAEKNVNFLERVHCTVDVLIVFNYKKPLSLAYAIFIKSRFYLTDSLLCL